MTVVKYESGIPKTVRDYCERHSHQVESVDFGGRSETWRYMAWLRSGWNQGDDIVHSVIGETAKDLIARLREIAPCYCVDCLSTKE